MVRRSPKPIPSIAAPFERIRNLCFDLPGTIETTSWGHPNFRASNRTYLTLEMHDGRPSVAFRLPADQVKALCEEATCFPTPYGKGLWVSTYVDRRLNWSGIKYLVAQSHRQAIADHTPKKRRTPRAKGPKTVA
jgi:predicted DNA-binding protein (MmcQ/YjbR family)